MKYSKLGPAARIIAIGLLGTLPLAAQAQMRPAADAWQWNATIYVWLPTLSGNTSFPGGASGPSIDVDGGKVMDALKMAFMGNIGAKKGKYGFFTDVAYVDLGASKSGVRDFTLGHGLLPVGLSADLSYDIKATAWTTAGTYTLVASPDHTMDLLGGVRMLDMSQTLGWTFNGNAGATPLPGRTGSDSPSKTNWDGIIGVKGRINLDAGKKWFLPYYLDVGTGNSDLTVQTYAGVGYHFGWGSVTGVWRYMDYNFKSGNFAKDLTLNGPAIAATWYW